MKTALARMMIHHRICFRTTLVAVLTCSHMVLAQPPMSKETPAKEPPSISDILKSQPNAIIVPIQEFNRMNKPTGVFLPGTDVLKLQQELDRLKQARSAGVSRVQITGDLDDSWARLTAIVEARLDDPRGGDLRLDFNEAQCSGIEVKYRDPFRETFEVVPIGPAPMFKEDAQAPYVLRLDRPGAYTCRLSLNVEIDRGPTERRLQLTLPPAPVKSIRLKETAVQTGMRIERARQGKTEKNIVLDDNDTILAPNLSKDESLEIRWGLAPVSGTPSRGDASYGILCRYRPQRRVLEIGSEISVSARTERNELKLLIPPDDTIRRVQVLQDGRQIPASFQSGPAEGSWSRASIRTSAKLVGVFKLLVVCERPLPSASHMGTIMELPLARLESASLTSAQSVVDLRESESIRIQPAIDADRGWEPIPNERVEADLTAGPRFSAFQQTVADAAMLVRVERVQSVISASSLSTNLDVSLDSLKLMADAQLSIRQGLEEKVSIELPSELENVEARVDGVLANTERGEAHKNVRAWKISFGEKKSGDVRVRLQGVLRLQTEKLNVVPIPRIAEIHDTIPTVTVQRASNVRIRLAPETMNAFQIVPQTSSTNDRTWLTLRPNSSGIAWALGFSPHPVVGQTSALAEHLIEAHSSGIHVKTVFRWESAVDQLKEVALKVPEHTPSPVIRGERLAVPSKGLMLSPGSTTIPLSAPHSSVTATIEYDVPTSAAADRMSIPLVVPLADDIQHCWAELRAASDHRPLVPKGWELLPSAERASLELIDQPNPPIGLVVRSRTFPEMLNWQTEEARAVAHVVLSRMMVVEDWLASGRRKGHMLASMARIRRPILEWSVPKNFRVTDVLIEGKPSELATTARGDETLVHVRVDQAWLDAERPISLEIRYDAVTPMVFPWSRRELDIPKLAGNGAIDAIFWRISTPRDCLLIPMGGLTDAPLPTWYGVGRRLPGNWANADAGLAARDWVTAGGATLTWAPTTDTPTHSRTWSFESLNESGSVSLLVVGELYWIVLHACALALLGAVILNLKRPGRTWMILIVLGATVMAWVLAPVASHWIWIGLRWPLALFTLAWLLPKLGLIIRRARRKPILRGSIIARRSTLTPRLGVGPSSKPSALVPAQKALGTPSATMEHSE